MNNSDNFGLHHLLMAVTYEIDCQERRLFFLKRQHEIFSDALKATQERDYLQERLITYVNKEKEQLERCFAAQINEPAVSRPKKRSAVDLPHFVTKAFGRFQYDRESGELKLIE